VELRFKERIMDEKQLQRLLDRARTDRVFFHDLVFNTEAALKDLSELAAEDRERLLRLQPDAVLTSILTERRGCSVTVQCTWTCTQTASARALAELTLPERQVADCGVTVQCGHTCTQTVQQRQPFEDLGSQIKAQVERELGTTATGG
jgi:hypothetical protein